MKCSVLKNRVRENNIAKVFFFYWLILVMWQNLGEFVALSGMDLVIKVFLLSMLCAYTILKAKTISQNIIFILLLSLCTVITLWISGDSLSGRNLVTYVFPSLFALMTFGVGNSFLVTKKEYFWFLNGVICVSLYIALYAVFFQTEHILSAFRFNNAYGNELKSFMASNHEFAMYLVYAIISCLICIEELRNESYKKKLLYYFSLPIFFLNLVLSFSRTAYLSLCVFAFVFIFSSANTKLKRRIILIVILITAAIVFSENFRHLLRMSIFKGSTGGFSARINLYSYALEIFRNGDILEKIFGHGQGIRNVIKQELSQYSIHNAYLQVLVTNGIAGLLFLLGILLSQLIAYRELKIYSNYYSALFTAILLSGAATMFSNTPVIFTSPIDSYFLTVYIIVLPKYVKNAIVNNMYG